MGYYVSWASHLPPSIGEKTKAREVKTLFVLLRDL